LAVGGDVGLDEGEEGSFVFLVADDDLCDVSLRWMIMARMRLTGTLVKRPPSTAASGDSGKKLLLESGRGRYSRLSCEG
jgi:hypothetical protein